MKEEIEYIHWHKLIASQLALWQIKERVPADMAESNPSEGFITMSRMHGAGGDDMAQAIGKKLGWQVFDKELVEYIAVNIIAAPADNDRLAMLSNGQNDTD